MSQFRDEYANKSMEEIRDDGVVKSLFNFLKNSNIEIVLNNISIINIAYIIRKKFSKNEIKEKINLITNQYHIVCVSERAYNRC